MAEQPPSDEVPLNGPRVSQPYVQPEETLGSLLGPRPEGLHTAAGGQPEAPEGYSQREVDEWPRREGKRVKAVDLVKASPAYCEAQKRARAASAGAVAPINEAPIPAPEPQTPDPHDRTVSKRSWERVVLEWRAAL